MVGEVIVGDGDSSGPHDSIYKAIGAVGKGAVIYPDVAGTEDGNSITVGHCPPTIMAWGAANHRVASGLAVMDMESMDNNISDKLNGYAGPVCYMDICPTPIDGLEAVHNQLLFQDDDHVTLEYDPKGLVLDDGMPKSARARVDRIIVTGVSDDVVASITSTNGLAPKANPTVSQPFAVELPLGITAPAVVNGVASATRKKAKSSSNGCESRRKIRTDSLQDKVWSDSQSMINVKARIPAEKHLTGEGSRDLTFFIAENGGSFRNPTDHEH
ncbi:hypothetical protein ACLOJK_011056 [Asimina triloba]